MKLLKILLVIFVIYFIRRFIQVYKALAQQRKYMEDVIRKQQAEAANQQRPQQSQSDGKVVEADFKVL